MLLTIFELGLLYALVAFAVYLSFRIVNFPDLTVDGSFPLGAAVAASLIVHGVNPLLATFSAFVTGLLAGCLTGYLHVYLRMMGLLASILTMSALYSINLRIMGKPNIALFNEMTLFSKTSPLLVLAALVFIIAFCLKRFLSSDYGLALRACGSNPKLSHSYGINLGKMTIFALALSNGLVALAGALFAQLQGFADLSFGTGLIITGLASLMLGEALCGRRSLSFDLLGCVLGALLYRAALALALNTESLGLEPSDLNMLTAALIVLALILFSPLMLRGAK